jgi:hypothetical protein
VDISDGATLAVGGFGLCGIPDRLIEAIAQSSATMSARTRSSPANTLRANSRSN